jgi:hypothetical protein
MKQALNQSWKWLVGVLLTLLGFSSCSKPDPVPTTMYGPPPGVYMYGPRPSSFKTLSQEGSPSEELPMAEIPELQEE